MSEGRRTPLVIQGVEFGLDHTQITYHVPSEAKANGVAVMHVLLVPMDEASEYHDEVGAALDALKHLVRDVLDDLPHLEAFAAQARPETPFRGGTTGES